MSRIVGLTLLLIILVNVCDNTAASAQFLVTKQDIRKCRCIYVHRGKVRCPSPLIPTDNKGKQDLHKCLCRVGLEQNRPVLQQFCRALGSATPL